MTEKYLNCLTECNLKCSNCKVVYFCNRDCRRRCLIEKRLLKNPATAGFFISAALWSDRRRVAVPVGVALEQ